MALTRITKGVIKPNENYDTHNINSTGIVTALGLDVNGNGDISGDLNVGGILTYEDVTSIDSVGIITAQKGIHVGAGVSAVGVGTFGSLDIGGDIDVDGHTNLDNVSVAGVTTITSSTYPLVVHADTAYQGILVNGNGAPTIGFNVNDNSTPSWKAGLSGSSHLDFAISQGTGNSNRLTLKNGGGAGIVGYFTAEGFGMDEHIYHLSGNDTDTRIRFPGADTFSIDTNGVERLRINSTGITTFTGNVFLSKDLDVDGHTNLDNVSVAGITTFSDDVQLTVANGNGILLDKSGNQLLINSGTHVRYQNNNEVNTDDGKIGTALFDSGLNIVGSQTGSGLGRQIRLYGDLLTNNIKPTADSTHSIGTSSNRFANVYADTLYGDGSNLTGITGTTINNNANNRVITGSGTANTLEAESNLTFTGSILTVTNSSGASEITLVTPNNTDSGIYFNDGSNSGALSYQHSDNSMRFRVNATEKVRITSAGRMGINETSPDSLLHVRNDNSYAAKFGGEGGGSEYYMEIGQLASNGSAGFNATGTSGSMLFKINGSEKLRIDPDGDLGLGDTNPNIRLTVVDSGTENLVRLGRSDASGHASHTVNVKASKDFYHHFKMEASSYNLDCYNGSAMIEAFKVHNSGYAELAGANDVRLTLGNYGTAGSNGANWLRGVSNSLYYNAGAGSHLWEIAGAEHMQLRSDGNLYLRSETANYVVLGSNGSATSSGISNNMNWIRGNGANTQYNTSGGFHAWEVSGAEKLRLEAGGEIRLTSQNGNNSDTPGITFRGGSTTQSANFARIHSRMVSNWGGQLQFKVKNDNGSLSDAYQTAMIMDHNGHITKPQQPAFSAADTAGHVYGSSSTPTMVFNNADFNVGNNYNTSTGIFTAPIAGKYQFSFCGMAAGGAGDFQARITKNGGGYFNNNGSGRGYSTFEPYGFTVLMDLAVNDEVQIKIYSSNTSAYMYAGQLWNRFSGYLIG